MPKSLLSFVIDLICLYITIDRHHYPAAAVFVVLAIVAGMDLVIESKVTNKLGR